MTNKTSNDAFRKYSLHSCYLNKALINVDFGILKIIDKSSKKLLLFDKNFITVLAGTLNISQNIFGIFSGLFFKTFKKISSKNLYLF